MDKSAIVFPLLVSLVLLVPSICNEAIMMKNSDSVDWDQSWGYVEVRPKAHMFYWYFRSPNRTNSSDKPWPTVLWLQGGPGSSGTGIGNFQEIGPLDTHLEPRNSTWLQKADLMFVDNPVGTGYSYVEDPKLAVKTDVEAAIDLTALLVDVFGHFSELQSNNLYIVAESYGGKYAVTTGLKVLESIKAGKLKTNLAGIALGDSWISPEDFVFSWGPLLKEVSRLDKNGLLKLNSIAEKISEDIKAGNFQQATDDLNAHAGVVYSITNNVDLYNFMLDRGMDPVSLIASDQSQKSAFKRYSRYLDSLHKSAGLDVDLHTLMNVVIRKQLQIIPDNVIWDGQSGLVYESLTGDFMRPRINEVDQLLAQGVNVTVYNGQLDIMCSTPGAEAWVEKLKWDGLKTFLNMERTPLYCRDGGMTEGFVKSYKNFHFYWILGSGHFVPAEQPCIALNMISNITQSPAA